MSPVVRMKINISKIICLLFQHKMSSFAYDALNSCWQKRYCIRCEEEEIMEGPHNYEKWKYEDSGCLKVRVCQRCEKKETVENHEGSETSISGEWIDDKICQKQRICQRCGRVIAIEKSFHHYVC